MAGVAVTKTGEVSGMKRDAVKAKSAMMIMYTAGASELPVQETNAVEINGAEPPKIA